jgi:hypothetical protein
MSDLQQDLDLLEFEIGVNAASLSPHQGLRGLAAEAMVIRPEVIRLLTAGVPERELCESLGVSRMVLHRCMREADFAALMEIEIRRVLRHMSRRNLKDEKYLQLATSVAMMVDKMRLMRDEPTSIQRGQTITIIENLTVGLLGRGRESSERISGFSESNEPSRIHDLPALPEHASEDTIEPVDLVDSLD